MKQREERGSRSINFFCSCVCVVQLKNIFPLPGSVFFLQASSQILFNVYCTRMHPSLLSTGGAPVASLESRGGPGDGSGQEEGRGQDEVVGLGGGECGEPTRLEGVGRFSCKMEGLCEFQSDVKGNYHFPSGPIIMGGELMFLCKNASTLFNDSPRKNGQWNP